MPLAMFKPNVQDSLGGKGSAHKLGWRVKGVFLCTGRPRFLLCNLTTGYQLHTSVKGVFLFHVGFHCTVAIKLARKGLRTLADGDFLWLSPFGK